MRHVISAASWRESTREMESVCRAGGDPRSCCFCGEGRSGAIRTRAAARPVVTTLDTHVPEPRGVRGLLAQLLLILAALVRVDAVVAARARLVGVHALAADAAHRAERARLARGRAHRVQEPAVETVETGRPHDVSRVVLLSSQTRRGCCCCCCLPNERRSATIVERTNTHDATPWQRDWSTTTTDARAIGSKQHTREDVGGSRRRTHAAARRRSLNRTTTTTTTTHSPMWREEKIGGQYYLPSNWRSWGSSSYTEPPQLPHGPSRWRSIGTP